MNQAPHVEGPSALELCPWVARYRHRRPRLDYAVGKRLLDVVIVALFSPLILLVLGLAALAIKVESPRGPLLHRQNRTGYRSERFTVYKLRTMVPDAEARKESLRHLNERQWPDFKITDDPRVLRTGRLFRSTGIDELPQLWNVFRGDMTLVGPRPTTLEPEAYQHWQLARFSTRPGLTGLWQISARNDPSFVQRIRLDLAYVRRRCLLFDLEILARTVLVTMRGDGV